MKNAQKHHKYRQKIYLFIHFQQFSWLVPWNVNNNIGINNLVFYLQFVKNVLKNLIFPISMVFLFGLFFGM